MVPSRSRRKANDSRGTKTGFVQKPPELSSARSSLHENYYRLPSLRSTFKTFMGRATGAAPTEIKLGVAFAHDAGKNFALPLSPFNFDLSSKFFAPSSLNVTTHSLYSSGDK